MTQTFLNELASRGIKLVLENGRLRSYAAVGAITDDISDSIREKRQELISYLSGFPDPARGAHPVSFAQERIWFLNQIGEETAQYNMIAAFKLNGHVDSLRLQSAFNATVAQQPILDTRYFQHPHSQELLQTPQVPGACSFREVNLVTDPCKDSDILDFIRSEEAYRFDLSSEPSLRGTLLRINETSSVLIVCVHHIAADGWSVEVLINTLNSILSGQASFSARPYSYYEYALNQRCQLRKDSLRPHLEFWSRELLGIPTVHSLPLSKARPPQMRYACERIIRSVNSQLRGRLAKLASQQESTLYSTLSAIFGLVISRFSGELDVVIGCPVANRAQRDTLDLIGAFFTYVPLRIKINDNLTARELLLATKKKLFECYAHQDVPFSEIATRVNPTRSLSYHPIFQVVMSFENYSQFALSIPGTHCERIEFGRAFTNFDLTLNVKDFRGELCLEFEYASELFDGSFIESLADSFLALCEEITEEPDKEVLDFPLLSVGARESILIQRNKTDYPFPDDVCIHHLFERQVDRTPDLTAVEFEGSALSYRELNSAANAAASLLRQLGVGPGSLVAICLDRSLELVVSMLAILKVGAAYVPIDTAFPKARKAFLLRNGNPRAVFAAKDLEVPEESQDITRIDPHEFLQSDQTFENLRTAVSSRDLAYVIYTSGSTGDPKGVMTEHRALVNRICWMKRNYGITERDIILQKTPYTFDVSVWEFLLPLVSGAKLVLASPGKHTNPDYLFKCINAHKVTFLHFVPSVLNLFLDTVHFSACDSVAQVCCSGEALSLELKKKFFHSGTKAKLHNLYGPTEAAIDVSFYECSADSQMVVPIGRPIDNVQLYVLDSRMRPVPDGVVGDLYIGGIAVARGYLGRDNLTQSVFVPDPFSGNSDARLYKTGDRASYTSAGDIIYHGRSDFQVKIQGVRIELGEIETPLCRIQGVDSAVVLSVSTPTGESRLEAFLQVASTSDDAIAKLAISELQSSLPAYMVPSRFHLVSTIPLNANGKVDRKELLSTSQTSDLRQTRLAGNRTETRIAQIWEKVLGAKISSLDQNFFLSGGHSLVASRVVQLIAEEFKVDLPLGSVFLKPTVRELADYVDGRRNYELSGSRLSRVLELEPHQDEQDFPVSFVQQGIWFMEEAGRSSAVFNITHAFRFAGEFNVVAFQAAVNGLLSRHPVLRAKFELMESGEVRQIARLKWTCPFLVDRLVDETKGLVPQQIEELIRKEIRAPFDLQQDCLIRFRVLLAESYGIIIATVHHIAADGGSLPLLFSEMGTLYEQALGGALAMGASPPKSYLTFAAWQRREFTGERLRDSLAYWRERLGNLPIVHSLPTKARHENHDVNSCSVIHTTLTLEDASCLERFRERTKSTTYSVLLTAFVSVLSRFTGERDIVVGAPVSIRPSSHFDRTIGPFINNVVLRFEFEKEDTLAAALRQIQERVGEALSYQEFPFQLVVKELNPPRMKNLHPLFQILFSYLDYPSQASSFPLQELQPLALSSAVSPFDLTIEVVKESNTHRLQVIYNHALFERETISQLLDAVMFVIRSLEDLEDSKISELPLPSSAWGVLGLPSSDLEGGCEEATLLELFTSQLEQRKDRLAIETQDDSMTYRELDETSTVIARGLLNRGVAHGDFVALAVERGKNLVPTMLGIMKAGAAYVPLDLSYPEARIELILRASGARVLVSDSSKIPSDRPGAVVIRLGDLLNDECTAARPLPTVRGNDLAYVIFTSGSTGTPKGVMVEHRSVATFGHSMIKSLGINNRTRVLGVTSVSFDIHVLELLVPLCAGGTIALANAEAIKDPQGVGQFIELKNVNLLQATPSFWSSFVETGAVFTQPVTVLSGGEPLSFALKERLLQDPHVTLLNMYGPTEATVWASMERQMKGAPVRLGAPIPGTSFVILDENHQPCPFGFVGQLWIGGAGLARGYHNDVELTAAKFVELPIPLRPKERWYATGDLVRRHFDGNLEILGRNDSQIKLNGHRIELGEIDAALQRSSCVQESVTILASDPTGHPYLASFVLAKVSTSEDASKLDRRLMEEQIRVELSHHLPTAWLPSAINVVDCLPRTPNNKVDRAALPTPILNRSQGEARKVETRFQKHLLEVCSEVLGFSNINLDDNFFMIGGHSLSAMKVVARFRNRFGIDIPISEFLAAETLGHLAETMDEVGASESSRLESFRKDEGSEVSFGQQRLWVTEMLQPGTSAYNMPICLRLQGLICIDTLKESFFTLLSNHDVLRTSIVQTLEGDLQSRIVHASELRDLFQQIEGSSLSPSELDNVITREFSKSFSLVTQAPIRALAVSTSETELFLIVVIHHIAADAWSIDLLIKEFAAIYDALRNGTEVPPRKSVQYRDFALRQRAFSFSRRCAEGLERLKQRLQTVPVTHSLPTSRSRLNLQSARGQTFEQKLGPEVVKSFSNLCAEEACSRFVGINAALSAVFAGMSGTEEIVLGVPVANRTDADFNDTIGFFVNSMVLYNQPRLEEGFREALRNSRESVLEALRDQDVPFELLLDELKPVRSLGHAPIFQILLNFRQDEAAHTEFSFSNVSATVVKKGVSDAKFDLTVNALMSDDELKIDWEFDANLFDIELIQSFASLFTKIVIGAVESPDKPLRAFLVDQRATDCMRRLPKCAPVPRIEEMFEVQATASPEAIALLFQSVSITYGELNERSNMLAHVIAQVTDGTRVAVLLDEGVEQICAMLACLKAGKVIVPIATVLPDDRIRYIVADSRADLLITGSQCVPVSGVKRLEIDTFFMQGNPTEDLLAFSSDKPVVDSQPQTYIVYTSGTTGVPKGIAQTHSLFSRFLSWQNGYFCSKAGERMAVWAPLHYDAAICEVFGALSSGATLCIPPREAKRDIFEAVCWIEDFELTILQFVPSYFQLILRAWEQNAGGYSKVKRIFLAGEAIPKQLLSRFFALRGAIPKIYNLYGPSEAILATAHELSREDISRSFVPVGVPLDSREVYIVDEDHLPVTDLIVGQIVVRSPDLPARYIGGAAEHSSSFIDNKLSGVNTDRMYTTGDMGRRWPNGLIEFLGRRDSQVKIRGNRLELEEISVVAEAYAGVSSASAHVFSHQGDLLWLFVTLEAPIKSPQLLSFMASKLPSHMMPEGVTVLDSLPRTSTGKLDRSKLLPPQVGEHSEEDVSVACDLEGVILDVCRNVLGKQSLVSTQSFFEAGGDSLRLLKVQLLIEDRTGVKVPIVILFRHPTARALSQALSSHYEQREPCSSIRENARPERRKEIWSRATRRLRKARTGDETLGAPEEASS